MTSLESRTANRGETPYVWNVALAVLAMALLLCGIGFARWFITVLNRIPNLPRETNPAPAWLQPVWWAAVILLLGVSAIGACSGYRAFRSAGRFSLWAIGSAAALELISLSIAFEMLVELLLYLVTAIFTALALRAVAASIWFKRDVTVQVPQMTETVATESTITAHQGGESSSLVQQSPRVGLQPYVALLAAVAAIAALTAGLLTAKIAALHWATAID